MRDCDTIIVAQVSIMACSPLSSESMVEVPRPASRGGKVQAQLVPPVREFW